MENWKQGAYNTYSRRAGFLQLSVQWALVARGEPTGYRYSVGDIRGKALFDNWEDAAREAEKVAREELRKALDILGDFK